jgi:hypothetical protein
MNPENNLFRPPVLPPHTRGRKPGPILSSHEHKKARKVVPYTANRAPSVAHYHDLHEAVKEHAFMRIQLFITRAKLFEGQAVKSDGTLHNVHFKPGHAHQQQGSSKIKWHHAAHANDCAGIKENLKEAWLKDIETMREITPRKQRNFKQRGISQETIESMQKALDQGLKIRKELEQLMPGPGFLDHTQADDLLNATDLLPQEVNLQVDKVLEDRIREKSAEITGMLSRSKITVKAATEQYVHCIKKIFNDYKKELNQERNQLLNIVHLSPKENQRKNQIQRLVSYVDDEIQGTELPPDILF